MMLRPTVRRSSFERRAVRRERTGGAYEVALKMEKAAGLRRGLIWTRHRGLAGSGPKQPPMTNMIILSGHSTTLYKPRHMWAKARRGTTAEESRGAMTPGRYERASGIAGVVVDICFITFAAACNLLLAEAIIALVAAVRP